ncbi:MAG: 3-oxoacyl-[acyl-carrier-protein] reductase [Bacillus thermozeamaize]|uniref:3-oxoacyl-[acyl-carrier-protein] reductase n=1 Tax=Bacillus thermozeamaize TaxID=230954 RepID=A0A1Y3PLU9_9BACI|nr:MAG: 3-oxoacyl-[acyl-carrier-protein] reductase [Bacillus thermozeamaize]
MLSGKVALVTGASRGIGRAIALELARSGADVAVNFAGSRQAAEEVAAQIQEMGRKSMAIQANVSEPASVEAMFREVEEQLGPVQILVNNAGITRDNLLLRMKEAEWDEVLSTNLKGVFLCTKQALRPMLKGRWGRIINITSVSGVMGNAGQANYAAAKAGVIGLTKTTAREVASRGITVNAIAPGFIETDMTAALGEEVSRQLLGQIPLGRFGQAEEVARVARFLASDDSSYITGQVIHVDGGMVM